jgi:hypothetical protein
MGVKRRVAAICVGAFVLIELIAPLPLLGDETFFECRVLYEAAGGIYVDAGTTKGMREGLSGQIERNGSPLGQVEVQRAAADSAFLVWVAERPQSAPKPGERVSLVLDGPAPPVTPTRTPSPTLRDRDQGDPDFVPLLAPDLRDQAFTEVENVFHGKLHARQLYQFGSDDEDFSITRFGTSGSLERIAGTPWAIEWSGDLSYRTGSGLANTRYEHEARLEVYRLALYRRFDNGGVLRLGRFIPREIPAIGFVDGAQTEVPLGDGFRLGSVIGFKPTRFELEPNFEEIVLSIYSTLEAGSADSTQYSGTLGLLSTLFRGTPDRLAILLDQRLAAGNFSLYSSSELDLDVGSAIVRDGIRLTRLDLAAHYAFAPAFTLRAGIDRYEVPDNEGERDIFDPGFLDITEFFADGYWRYWIGASHVLPGSLTLSEEISFMDSATEDAVRWNVQLTRKGLPGLDAGSISVAVYNLHGSHSDGYGGKLSAFLPVAGQRVLIQPIVYFRFLEYETTGENFFDPVADDFTVTDVAVRAHWTASRAWSLSGGVSYAIANDENRFLVDLGVIFRW